MSDSRQPKKQLQKAEIVDFYDHASPDLHRFLTRKLGNGEEAEEVAHDAFEKLLRQVEHENIKDLRRFFFTMANRMALDALRRREVQGRFLREPARRGFPGAIATLWQIQTYLLHKTYLKPLLRD